MTGLAYMASMGWGMDKDYGVSADWCYKALDAAGPGEQQAVDFAHQHLDWLANYL